MTGREIIKGVLSETGIGPKDFFSPSRSSHIVQARRVAAIEMNKAGFSKSAISRLIGRSRRTVGYYFDGASA